MEAGTNEHLFYFFEWKEFENKKERERSKRWMDHFQDPEHPC